MKQSLSVIIITKNNVETIETCLRSIAFADEIIVLDSGSTDQTREICRQYTHHVYETNWPGFGPQKNRALGKATGDWVFSIDSDEWIGDELRYEIVKTIAENETGVFSVKRCNRYCGYWIRHGDVGRDRVVRLFKRGTAQFSNDIVHEKVISRQPIQKLQSLLFHDSYRSIDELLSRMNQYTTLSAQIRNEKGKKTSMGKALFSSIWAFTRSYFFRAGFLDGKAGLIVAISSAESSFYRHVKLMETQGVL